MANEQLWRQFVDVCDRLDMLSAAIAKHAAARGHDRCWENDLELYRAAGIPVPPQGELPPIEEHRAECDRYRAGLYGCPKEATHEKYLRGLATELNRILDRRDRMGLVESKQE